MDFVSENRAALYAHFGGLMRTDWMSLATLQGRFVLTDLWIRVDLFR
jgi:hypothetical protein